VLLPDGKRWRKLLDQNDGISGPCGISIDRTTNYYLVVIIRCNVNVTIVINGYT
jgi:hypothetical protein